MQAAILSAYAFRVGAELSQSHLQIERRRQAREHQRLGIFAKAVIQRIRKRAFCARCQIAQH